MSAVEEFEPVRLPITGELDLHHFQPGDLGALIPAYLSECAAAGLQRVRIIHGKGIGTLRRTVHARLRHDPRVAAFATASETEGGWGATVVFLK